MVASYETQKSRKLVNIEHQSITTGEHVRGDRLLLLSRYKMASWIPGYINVRIMCGLHIFSTTSYVHFTRGSQETRKNHSSFCDLRLPRALDRMSSKQITSAITAQTPISSQVHQWRIEKWCESGGRLILYLWSLPSVLEGLQVQMTSRNLCPKRTRIWKVVEWR